MTPSPTMEPGRDDSPSLAWVVVFALPIFYILSVGPANLLHDHVPVLREVLRVIYAPLIWLMYHAPFGSLIAQYAELWG